MNCTSANGYALESLPGHGAHTCPLARGLPQFIHLQSLHPLICSS